MNPVPELGFRNVEPGKEAGGLDPVPLEGLLPAVRGRNGRPRHLDTSAQLA